MKKYNIGWGITNSCNMNCKFCYSKETRHKSSDAQLEDWIKFIDENHEYVESINYGTGENALSNDFFTFIDYVRTKYPNIKQSLTSNGYISEAIQKDKTKEEIFIKAIDEVDVSLDFGNKEKHTYFRGQPKAYDWAINTLELLNKYNKLSTIVFVGFEETMQKENIDSLFKIAKKYNSLVRLNIYRPVSESEEINKKFILSYKTLMEMLKYIGNEYEIVGLSDILLGNLLTDQKDIVENTGVDSIRILPDGSICPSTYLIDDKYKNQYNIRQENVLENIKFDEFQSVKIPDECINCTLREKCRGGVYDRRVLWNNTLDKRDPYCPFENDDTLSMEKYKVKKKERISVHDGYLPTMFFKNKEK